MLLRLINHIRRLVCTVMSLPGRLYRIRPAYDDRVFNEHEEEESAFAEDDVDKFTVGSSDVVVEMCSVCDRPRAMRGKGPARQLWDNYIEDVQLSYSYSRRSYLYENRPGGQPLRTGLLCWRGSGRTDGEYSCDGSFHAAAQLDPAEG
jgi:hypothetical protein